LSSYDKLDIRFYLAKTGIEKMTESQTRKLLLKLGTNLGFHVGEEIQASDSAWVDIVWFDSKFDYGPTSAEDRWIRVKTWRLPVIPIVGFELEASAGTKTVKGSVANLDNLGAAMNILLLCEENVNRIRNRGNAHRQESDVEIWKFLVTAATQWVYAEARPKSRIVVMTEPEVKEWAAKKGVTLDS